MILQQWQLILALECILLCISNQSLIQKRQCAFQVNPQNPQNNIYTTAGNVSGSVQFCENTYCCVGYFLINNSQPEVDLLACDIVEKSCPDATCRPQTRFSNHVIKCVCHTDLCNSNITWTPELEEPPLASVETATAVILFGHLVVLIFVVLLVVAVKWRNLFQDNYFHLEESQQASLHDSHVSPLCSCQTTKASEIDIANIELQRIVANGHFATVWQGKYKGSMVAVKVIPARWKHQFTTEKEVYELPLMKHAGIVHFLGTGRKPYGDSWLTVLEFAEYGSLHSFLCKHTTSWMLSLKLCQSLSQGLSYLHSDLHSNDVHKPPVAHRDLSSFNVLMRADGTCALSDFGCSTILRSCSGPRRRQSCTRNTVISVRLQGHAQVGTLCYMSPEILEGSVNLHSGWCLQGDVYALGLLLWEIWMRCSDLFEGHIVPQHLMPYESELGASMTLGSLTWYVFHMEKRPSIPEHWELLPQGSVLQELLTDCWDSDPDARLTAWCVADRLVSLQSCHSL
ncbi:anti-Muellerian hormone type-2 receptor-like isoform X1 [Thunnus albacares]|uniref:anti-Muellerian hormone type-2 receptor-like isoform X1 n=1 Tax=Thunnus maccoyii TaxID=8240 RepID=UPI001C4CB720|nr:anti-Muellerian hormone type-2 receptor-like isoform X1 [Thunnus maccoyii]XP_044206046.1 anti-Muellerian hormone type-2 receptor-like isoform X1 [Thunnus albacares]